MQDTPRWVNPNIAKYAEGWRAFRARQLLLPLAYWQPVNDWTHRPAPTPARDFPTLDAWLEAERTGSLTDTPLYEPFLLSVTSAAWHLGIIPKDEVQDLSDGVQELFGRRLRSPWPRVCCKCGSEFRTTDGRQREAKRIVCPACRAAARRQKGTSSHA
jgi:hypothetical protein